jgi:hypothetical protein
MVPDRTSQRTATLKYQNFPFGFKVYLTENTVSLNFYRNYGNRILTQALTQKYYMPKYKENVKASNIFLEKFVFIFCFRQLIL